MINNNIIIIIIINYCKTFIIFILPQCVPFSMLIIYKLKINIIIIIINYDSGFFFEFSFDQSSNFPIDHFVERDRVTVRPIPGSFYWVVAILEKGKKNYEANKTFALFVS